MTEVELKSRTKQFALRIIRLVESLPKNVAGRAIGNHLVRCGTSVGANYRFACRGRSRADFASKLAIVEEEADESAFWLELIVESKLVKPNLITPLLKEAEELTRIFAASTRSARRKPPNP